MKKEISKPNIVFIPENTPIDNTGISIRLTVDEFFEIYDDLLTDRDKYKVLQEVIRFQKKIL